MINYSNLSNIPSTFQPIMTNIYSKTEIDNIATLNNFYNKINIDSITSNLYSSDITVYSEEIQYPPKAYNSASPLEQEITTEILNKSSYKETLTLTTSSILYGSGNYIIYYPTPSPIIGQTTKRQLLDRNINNYARSGALFDTQTGYYTGSEYIKNNYIGDWNIIKLPNKILLTKQL